jgi:xylulokinase
MASAVTVSSGGGDNMMGAIGSGNVEPGLVTLSLGTSGTVYSYSTAPVTDRDGEIAAFCDSTGAWLPLGCTMNVTVATEMIRDKLLPLDHQQYDQSVEGIPAGADGLILLPYLEGERMPSVPLGTGVLLGLRQSTASPAHLARAAMEGVTMGLRYGLAKLQQLGISPTEVRLIGGGARSPVWRQIVADVFNLPVVCLKNQEGPAFGAALQAMWCSTGTDIRGLARSYVVSDEETREEPIGSNPAVYERLYRVYEQLSRTLINSETFSLHRQFIRQEKGS